MGETLNFSQLANYGLPDSLRAEGKVHKVEISPELKFQIKEYLQRQGYEITEEAKRIGKSGVEHTFDILAQRDNGFTSYTIAISIAAGGNRETEANTIFHFANKREDFCPRGIFCAHFPKILRAMQNNRGNVCKCLNIIQYCRFSP